jgi:hypothetical protein
MLLLLSSVLVQNVRIANLKHALANEHGVREAEQKLCHDNALAAKAALERSNASVAALKAFGDKVTADAEKALADARRATAGANRRAEAILARKPGADLCVSIHALREETAQ